MLNYQQFIKPEVMQILEKDIAKKEKFEKSLVSHIAICETSFISNEYNEFISNMNQQLLEQYPGLNISFVTLTGDGLIADGNQVFTFDNKKSTSENFVEFLKEKDNIINHINALASNKNNNLDMFYLFLDEVYAEIQENENIQKNPFFKEIKFYKFTAKYVEVRNKYSLPSRQNKPNKNTNELKLMVTFQYNSVIQNPFEVNFKMNMNEYERKSLKANLIYKLQAVLTQMEKEKLKIVDQEIQKTTLRGKVISSIMSKWSEPKKYWFNPFSKRLYVSVLYLSMTEQEKEELLYKANNILKIIDSFRNYSSIFNRDLVLTDDDEKTESFSIEKQAININFDTDSTSFKEFVLDINEKINSVIKFDELNIIPTEDFSVFKRYFFKTIDTFTLNDDLYTIYKFRGKQNRTFVRGFKNGQLMSTHQLAKSYKKRKAMNL